MAAIILTGGIIPEPETIEKANEEGIPIFTWPGSSFDLAVLIHKAGVKLKEKG